MISIGAKWPKEFDGVGDPNNVASEFVTQGTLLAAPLTTLIALVVFTALTRLQRWLAAAGLAGLTLLGVLFTIGTLGEPFDPVASDAPLALLIVWRVIGLVLCLSLLGLASAALYVKAREWRA